MREIKFRAWNGRKMFDVDVLAINGVSWDSGGTGVSLAYQPSIKVMQYTGLNDKNNTAIYEGDIVKSAFGKSHAVVKYVTVRARFEAGDIDATFDWSLSSICAYGTAEVIGNIYENPELLEV